MSDETDCAQLHSMTDGARLDHFTADYLGDFREKSVVLDDDST